MFTINGHFIQSVFLFKKVYLADLMHTFIFIFSCYSAISERNALWEYMLWVDCVCRCMRWFRLKTAPSSFLTNQGRLRIAYQSQVHSSRTRWLRNVWREGAERKGTVCTLYNSEIFTTAALMHTFTSISSHVIHASTCIFMLGHCD